MHPLDNPNPFIRRPYLLLVAIPVISLYVIGKEGWTVIREFLRDFFSAFTEGWETLTDRCSYLGDTFKRLWVYWSTPGTAETYKGVL